MRQALHCPQRTDRQYASFDHVDRYPAALKYLGEKLQDGSLKRKFHIVEGLENAPSAMNLLFTGGNTGKLSVLSADPLFFSGQMLTCDCSVVKVASDVKAKL